MTRFYPRTISGLVEFVNMLLFQQQDKQLMTNAII